MDIPKVKRGYLTNEVKSITAIGSTVLVSEMNFEHRVSTGGIILPGDDAKNSGIRPRWAKVYAVGPDQTDVRVGQWILVDHGRWTRGIEVEVAGVRSTIRKVDNKDILLVSDHPVHDGTMGDKVY